MSAIRFGPSTESNASCVRERRSQSLRGPTWLLHQARLCREHSPYLRDAHVPGAHQCFVPSVAPTANVKSADLRRVDFVMRSSADHSRSSTFNEVVRRPARRQCGTRDFVVRVLLSRISAHLCDRLNGRSVVCNMTVTRTVSCRMQRSSSSRVSKSVLSRAVLLLPTAFQDPRARTEGCSMLEVRCDDRVTHSLHTDLESCVAFQFRPRRIQSLGLAPNKGQLRRADDRSTSCLTVCVRSTDCQTYRPNICIIASTTESVVGWHCGLDKRDGSSKSLRDANLSCKTVHLNGSSGRRYESRCHIKERQADKEF